MLMSRAGTRRSIVLQIRDSGQANVRHVEADPAT